MGKKEEKFIEFLSFLMQKTTEQKKQKPTIKHTFQPQKGLLLPNNQPKM